MNKKLFALSALLSVGLLVGCGGGKVGASSEAAGGNSSVASVAPSSQAPAVEPVNWTMAITSTLAAKTTLGEKLGLPSQVTVVDHPKKAGTNENPAVVNVVKDQEVYELRIYGATTESKTGSVDFNAATGYKFSNVKIVYEATLCTGKKAATPRVHVAEFDVTGTNNVYAVNGSTFTISAVNPADTSSAQLHITALELSLVAA